MAKPIVAIVGRPNVGKSTLFNRILGARLSIVDDSPGVTRDRLYADTDWCGRLFTLVDTGGIQQDPADSIAVQTRTQAELAVGQADVIVFVVDSRQGITPDDVDVANLLRRAEKPVIVAANKVEDLRHLDYDIWGLGLGEPIPVSAIHGTGVGDLLDAVIANLPDSDDHEEDEEDAFKVAVIGRPNVGKSSIVNRILGEERSIVSDEPGTTRDAIDTPFERNGDKYVIVDTAGIRRKSKVAGGVERYSVLRALRAVDRCDVAITVFDGTENPSEQDTKIAGYAHDAGRASVLAVNKWDIVERDESKAREYERRIRAELSFMPYAPVLFVSAKTGRRIGALLDAVAEAARQHRRRVPTSQVNKVIEDTVLRYPPPEEKGKRVRIFYTSQVGTKPPTFAVFANHPELIHFSYRRHLENTLRDAFGFAGTPVNVVFRRRE
ncbi:MAG: ribosome biogenesis GTPase Der [Firmicutes bacterium]|jgi:GTP-binding protein|nr:ribosome biogenesis GTPase Der [Bacillota bacterium]